MQEKSQGIIIGMVIGAIIVVGVALPILLLMPAVKQNSPQTTTTHTAQLTLVDGNKQVPYTLAQIQGYINNGNITLVNVTASFNGTQCQCEGFNPLDLYYMNGWVDVDQVTFTTGAGTSTTVNASTFMLGDVNYNSKASGDPTILVFNVNGTNLYNLSSSYGDFALIGSELNSAQQLFNITTLTYVSDWLVNVQYNGVTQYSFTGENMSCLVNTNYTSYYWGYINYSSPGNQPNYPQSWNQTLDSGLSIASLINVTNSVGSLIFGNSSAINNVTCIGADGYGSKFHQTWANITQGFVDPTLTLNNSLGTSGPFPNYGEQSMISHEVNGVFLNFHDYFRLFMPGNTKKYYVSWVNTINFQ